MKTNMLKIAMLLVATLLVTSCEHEMGKSTRVVVTQNSIILSGVDLTKSDIRAMNAILAQYKTTLFRLEDYEDGKVKKSTGDMSEAALNKAVASAHAKHIFSGGNLIGNTHRSTVIMCCGGNTHATPTPPAPQSADGQHLQTDPDFEELKQILEKYR